MSVFSIVFDDDVMQSYYEIVIVSIDFIPQPSILGILLDKEK